MLQLRVNPKSPMRLNAMRERERRHLDSLNYWKREFAPLPVAEHGACKKAACNASIDAYVPPKTRSASRNKVMPAPFPTTIVVTHGGTGPCAGGKQPAVPITSATTNSVISGKAAGGGGVTEAVSRRYAEFAKKLSPIQNSPQFFNHQLALENQPRALSPLKSPPTTARGLAAHNQTLLGNHHPMDLRSHRHSNFSHHKSAVYAMTATTAHTNQHQQQMPPPSYTHPVGGTGSVAGAAFGAEMGMGCHQAAMVGAGGHWNAAMGAPHYNGYYQPQVVVSRGGSGYGGGGGGVDVDCEEGCENTHPPDLVAVDGTGTKPAVEEDEELIFAIEI